MKRLLPLLIAGLLVLTLVPAPVHGDDMAFRIIVLRESKDYAVGDQVNLEIHCFYEGEYVDPDELTVKLGWDGREIETQKTDTGKYTASFTIEEGDIDTDWGGNIDAEATAKYQGYEGWGYTPIQIWKPSMTLNIDKALVEKGDTVTITAKFFNGSAPDDPDELELTLDNDGRSRAEPEFSKVETGLYTAQYLIDPQDTDSHVYGFEVLAQLAGRHLYGEVEAALRHYIVWYHNTSDFSKDNDIMFDVFVANPMGGPATGVNLDFNYELDTGGRAPGQLTGTTGDMGKASFTVPVADGEFANWLELEGWAEGPTLRQELEADFDFTSDDDDEYEPSDEGLDVHFETFGEVFFPPGKPVNLNCKVWLNGTPYQGELKVIGSNVENLVIKKSVNVQGGQFPLSFTMPQATGEPFDAVRISFQSYQGGKTYQDEAWVMASEGPMGMKFGFDVNVAPVVPGSPARVTAKGIDSTGFQGSVICIPYEGDARAITPENLMEVLEEAQENWQAISEAGDWEAAWPLMEQPDGSFTGEMQVPGFWVEVEWFIVIVLLREMQEGEGFMGFHFDGVVVRQGEGGDSDDGGFLPGFTGLELLPALCVVLLWASRKKQL